MKQNHTAHCITKQLIAIGCAPREDRHAFPSFGGNPMGRNLSDIVLVAAGANIDIHKFNANCQIK